MVERSAGAVIFRKEKGNILYLLLHYEEGHWDFPKGHIEKGEKTEDAIRREVEEETGIRDLDFVEGFKKTIKYMYKWPPKAKKQEFHMKFVVFWLAETSFTEVTLSNEHVNSDWLPYLQALERLTFKTAKDVFKAAHEFLSTAAINTSIH